MPKSPFITVIIPSYNAGDYLAPAITSILAQSFSNFEIIVVDDGSTDGSVQRSKTSFADPRIRWISQINTGKSAAINNAISIASGEFIALQDADDLSYPQRLEMQLEVLLNNPRAGAVYCGHDIIIENKRIAPFSLEKDFRTSNKDILSFRLPAHDPTIMFRKEIGEQLLFDTKLSIGEGLDFALRLGEKLPIIVVGKTLYSYRINRRSITQQTSRFSRQHAVASVIQRACQRRSILFEETFPHLARLLEGDDRYINNISRLSTHFMDSVVSQRLNGQHFNAILTAISGIRYFPYTLGYYKALIYAIVPIKIIKLLRKKESLS